MKKEAWIVAADMGYGHQRAAYPLKDIAYGGIINANSNKIVSKGEKSTWNMTRFFYEKVSKLTDFKIFGKTFFNVYDKIQEIESYYPKKMQTEPTYAVKYLEKKIKKGFCKGLISYVKKKKNIPFVTTFFTPAIAANYHNLSNIYCVITDSDINRIWVPRDPHTSTINYFAPCQHVVNRLMLYGVKKENIFLSGFPLPKECVGKNSEISKKFLGNRLNRLDPNKLFIKPHMESIKNVVGKNFNISNRLQPITLTFVIGGAGAQKEIGFNIINSLKKKIIENKIRLVLAVGTHLDIKQLFEDKIHEEGLSKHISKNIIIVAEISKKDYFAKFNQILNETDILWTKPSELSFYSALGIPIIIAPPIGSQEHFNKKWLFEIGAGLEQEDPKYVSEWIDEWLSDGRLARKAFEGYLNAPRMGTYEIEKILFKK